MIGYICKYAPIEIIESFGEEGVLMNPSSADVTHADAALHPNVCSFVKAVFEEFAKNEYDGMILTTCCDSSRRLYDALMAQFPGKFFYMIDLPRKINEFSTQLFEKRLREMAKAYADFSGKEFREKELVRICGEKVCAAEEAEKEENEAKSEEADKVFGRVRIGLAGARPETDFARVLKERGADVSFDMTCVSTKRKYKINSLSEYAAALLNQLPCMRMADASGRENLIDSLSDDIDGIIYHTVKFCDIYSYEYTRLRDKMKKPILAIETDASGTAEGQILTRIEAFIEEIGGRPTQKEHLKEVAGDAAEAVESEESNTAEEGEKKILNKAENSGTTENKGEMYFVGIDSGSTSTNAVLMNGDRKILAWEVVRTGAKSIESAERAYARVLEKAGIKAEDVASVISTGYGRVSIPFADRDITEITCHARGASFINPDVRTIIDIGGQDSKAISIGPDGSVTDFVMNDKCAAGTGRFLEMMARTLEIDIADMGRIGLEYTSDIEISSMCTVFAESEVISLIAQNKNTADIIHGLHRAVARKALSLLRRTGIKPTVMMTGGVAKNAGVVKALEEETGEKIFVYEEPDIVGAIGAALYGTDRK